MASQEEDSKLECYSNVNKEQETYFLNVYKKHESIFNNKNETFEIKLESIIDVWKSVGELNLAQFDLRHVIQIIDWAKLHALNIVLTAEWNGFKDTHQSRLLQEIEKAQKELLKLSAAFATRCQKLADVVRNPWEDPVLMKLMKTKDAEIGPQEIEFFCVETAYLVSVRLKKLCESQCEDLALNLVTAFMTCYKLSKTQNFNLNASETQVWFIFDTYIALLYKFQEKQKIVVLLKELTFDEGLLLVKRFAKKRVKIAKIWKNCHRVAVLAIQMYISQAVVKYEDDLKGVLTSYTELYLSLCNTENLLQDFTNSIRRISNLADAAGLYVFCDIIQRKAGTKLKPFIIEMYIRALTTDMNELERQKDGKEMEKAEGTTSRLAAAFCNMADFLNEHVKAARECVLTAFSLEPTKERLISIEDLARKSGFQVLDTGQDWKCKLHPPALPSDEIAWICQECGDWMCKPQLNLPKINMTLNEALQNSVLGISEALCDDLVVCLSNPRYQVLSWFLPWNDLHRLCMMYLQDPQTTKNFITELKFVDIDYSIFKDIKREPIDEFAGIERGYEQYLDQDFVSGDESANSNSEDSLSQDSRPYSLGSDGAGEGLYIPRLPFQSKSDPNTLKSLRMFRPNLKRKDKEPGESTPEKVIKQESDASGSANVSSKPDVSTSLSHYLNGVSPINSYLAQNLPTTDKGSSQESDSKNVKSATLPLLGGQVAKSEIKAIQVHLQPLNLQKLETCSETTYAAPTSQLLNQANCSIISDLIKKELKIKLLNKPLLSGSNENNLNLDSSQNVPQNFKTPVKTPVTIDQEILSKVSTPNTPKLKQLTVQVPVQEIIVVNPSEVQEQQSTLKIPSPLLPLKKSRKSQKSLTSQKTTCLRTYPPNSKKVQKNHLDKPKVNQKKLSNRLSKIVQKNLPQESQNTKLCQSLTPQNSITCLNNLKPLPCQPSEIPSKLINQKLDPCTPLFVKTLQNTNNLEKPLRTYSNNADQSQKLQILQKTPTFQQSSTLQQSPTPPKLQTPLNSSTLPKSPISPKSPILQKSQVPQKSPPPQKSLILAKSPTSQKLPTSQKSTTQNKLLMTYFTKFSQNQSNEKIASQLQTKQGENKQQIREKVIISILSPTMLDQDSPLSSPDLYQSLLRQQRKLADPLPTSYAPEPKIVQLPVNQNETSTTPPMTIKQQATQNTEKSFMQEQVQKLKNIQVQPKEVRTSYKRDQFPVHQDLLVTSPKLNLQQNLKGKEKPTSQLDPSQIKASEISPPKAALQQTNQKEVLTTPKPTRTFLNLPLTPVSGDKIATHCNSQMLQTQKEEMSNSNSKLTQKKLTSILDKVSGVELEQPVVSRQEVPAVSKTSQIQTDYSQMKSERTLLVSSPTLEQLPKQVMHQNPLKMLTNNLNVQVTPHCQTLEESKKNMIQKISELDQHLQLVLHSQNVLQTKLCSKDAQAKQQINTPETNTSFKSNLLQAQPLSQSLSSLNQQSKSLISHQSEKPVLVKEIMPKANQMLNKLPGTSKNPEAHHCHNLALHSLNQEPSTILHLQWNQSRKQTQETSSSNHTQTLSQLQNNCYSLPKALNHSPNLEKLRLPLFPPQQPNKLECIPNLPIEVPLLQTLPSPIQQTNCNFKQHHSANLQTLTLQRTLPQQANNKILDVYRSLDKPQPHPSPHPQPHLSPHPQPHPSLHPQPNITYSNQVKTADKPTSSLPSNQNQAAFLTPNVGKALVTRRSVAQQTVSMEAPAVPNMEKIQNVDLKARLALPIQEIPVSTMQNLETEPVEKETIRSSQKMNSLENQLDFLKRNCSISLPIFDKNDVPLESNKWWKLDKFIECDNEIDERVSSFNVIENYNEITRIDIPDFTDELSRYHSECKNPLGENDNGIFSDCSDSKLDMFFENNIFNENVRKESEKHKNNVEDLPKSFNLTENIRTYIRKPKRRKEVHKDCVEKLIEDEVYDICKNVNSSDNIDLQHSTVQKKPKELRVVLNRISLNTEADKKCATNNEENYNCKQKCDRGKTPPKIPRQRKSFDKSENKIGKAPNLVQNHNMSPLQDINPRVTPKANVKSCCDFLELKPPLKQSKMTGLNETVGSSRDNLEHKVFKSAVKESKMVGLNEVVRPCCDIPEFKVRSKEPPKRVETVSSSCDIKVFKTSPKKEPKVAEKVFSCCDIEEFKPGYVPKPKYKLKPIIEPVPSCCNILEFKPGYDPKTKTIRINESVPAKNAYAKSVLANVPGLNDFQMIRPSNVNHIVNVVQVSGNRSNQTVPVQSSQTSTQVTPHIQRIGQPRVSEQKSDLTTTTVTTVTFSNSSVATAKTTISQPSTLINILSQQVRPATTPIRRQAPLINIMSQQIVKSVPQKTVASTTSSTVANTESIASSNQVEPTVSTAVATQPIIINQIAASSLKSGGVKDASTTTTGQGTSTILQFICKSSLPKFQQAFGKPVYQNNTEAVDSTTTTLETNVTDAKKVVAKAVPVNVQPIQGSVIYSRQVPVGQTISLIPPGGTTRQVFRIATSSPEQISLVKDSIIHSKMSALLAAALQGRPKNAEGEVQINCDENTKVTLTRPTLVQNARIVKPVQLQLPTNVVRTTSQPNLSSTTLEQLREFDMVYKQIKERSTSTNPGETSNNTSETQEVTPQRISVTYVNQLPKYTQLSPVVVVTSYSSLQPAASPALSVTSQGSSSPCLTPASTPTLPKIATKNSKGKSLKSTTINSTSKSSPIPKPQQKPQEDEHTTQRIFDILAEYAEQLRNSPDLNNKPAPRRRSNPPTNPNQSSKRKKSSSGSKKTGQSSNTLEIDTDDITVGSEDSSGGGIIQLSVTDDEQSQAATTVTSQESTENSNPSSSRPVILADNTPVATQSRNVIIADSSVGEALKMPNTAVIVPGSYIMPVSMVKGAQQIAVVSGGSKILATVPARSGQNMLLFQSFTNQNRKGAISAVKYSTIQPISGISSQSLAGVSAQPPVILPSNSVATAVALGQPLTLKKIGEDKETSELVLTISPPKDEPKVVNDVTQPDSSTSVSIDSTDIKIEEPHLQSDNSHEKIFHTYQKSVITNSIGTSVIAATSASIKQGDNGAQNIINVDLPSGSIKGESKASERIQSVLVTACSSNGPMLSHTTPRYRKTDTGRTNNNELPIKEEFLHNGDKTNNADQKMYRNNATYYSSKSKKVSADSQKIDSEMQKQAAIERELRLQKSLSEECEDLGVDEPSTSDLFPEADLLFDSNHSPSFDQSSQDVIKRTPQSNEIKEVKASMNLFSDDETSSSLRTDLFEYVEYQTVETALDYQTRQLMNGNATGTESGSSGCEDNTLLSKCATMSDVTLNSPISPEMYQETNLNKYKFKYSNRKKGERAKPSESVGGIVTSSEDTICTELGKITCEEDNYKIVHIAITKHDDKEEKCELHCSEGRDSPSGRGARRSVRKMCSCCNGSQEGNTSRKRPHTSRPQTPALHKKAFISKKR